MPPTFTRPIARREGEAWTDDETKEPWDRDFQLIVPVRDVDFWRQAEVSRLLVETLCVLCDDNFAFAFRKMENEPAKQQYLEFGDLEDWPFRGVERVQMFSGGLDSLSGALDTASRGEKMVLVSHRPLSVQSSRQTKLFNAMREKCSASMIHVPVWVNKDEQIGREL